MYLVELMMLRPEAVIYYWLLKKKEYLNLV